MESFVKNENNILKYNLSINEEQNPYEFEKQK